MVKALWQSQWFNYNIGLWNISDRLISIKGIQHKKKKNKNWLKYYFFAWLKIDIGTLL